jgi:hypothetical protein
VLSDAAEDLAGFDARDLEPVLEGHDRAGLD